MREGEGFIYVISSLTFDIINPKGLYERNIITTHPDNYDKYDKNDAEQD